MAFDENIVCPLSGAELDLADDHLVSPSGPRYPISDGIPLLFVDEPTDAHSVAAEQSMPDGAVTHAVQDFYEDAPFPNYNSFDNLATFVRLADAGFARLPRDQIPPNANVVEVGCGTGQLSNYLAATTLSRVYATDMTLASLRMGHDFARRNRSEEHTSE